MRVRLLTLVEGAFDIAVILERLLVQKHLVGTDIVVIQYLLHALEHPASDLQSPPVVSRGNILSPDLRLPRRTSDMKRVVQEHHLAAMGGKGLQSHQPEAAEGILLRWMSVIV
jgi:hypothetical protein